MKKVFVNEKEVLVSDSATVMQACEIAGEEIQGSVIMKVFL